MNRIGINIVGSSFWEIRNGVKYSLRTNHNNFLTQEMDLREQLPKRPLLGTLFKIKVSMNAKQVIIEIQNPKPKQKIEGDRRDKIW